MNLADAGQITKDHLSMNIYAVPLKDGDTILEVVHVRAKSITEAQTKAMHYAKTEWAGSPQVAGVEETNINLIDETSDRRSCANS